MAKDICAKSMKASDVATIRSSLRSMGLTRCRLLQNWYECSSQSTHIFTKPFCFHTSGDTLDKVKTSRSLSPSPKMTSLKVSKTGWSTSVAAHSTTRSDVFQNNPYTDTSIEGISPHLLCNVHSSQLHRDRKHPSQLIKEMVSQNPHTTLQEAI